MVYDLKTVFGGIGAFALMYFSVVAFVIFIGG
jgi:hypothetical protein